MAVKRKRTYQKGLWAERLALYTLILKGYKHLATRYKTPFGEVDLMMKKGGSLICVEVKYRQTRGAALEAVQPVAQKRIINAGEFFRAHNQQYANLDMRFDIVTVTPPFSIHHHKNAWYAL